MNCIYNSIKIIKNTKKANTLKKLAVDNVEIKAGKLVLAFSPIAFKA